MSDIPEETPFVLEDIQKDSKWIPPFKKGRALPRPWIHVNEELPPIGTSVLVHSVAGNCIAKDQFGVECSVMHRGEKRVGGNDLVPWSWEAFGPGGHFAQEIDYWMPLPKPPEMEQSGPYATINEAQAALRARRWRPLAWVLYVVAFLLLLTSLSSFAKEIYLDPMAAQMYGTVTPPEDIDFAAKLTLGDRYDLFTKYYPMGFSSIHLVHFHEHPEMYPDYWTATQQLPGPSPLFLLIPGLLALRYSRRRRSRLEPS